MHFPFIKRKQEQGMAAFLVMICLAVVLGITAAGYMLLISSQHRLVSQSMNWNTALALAEAGIEEGLSQLNVAYGTNYVGSAMTNWTYTGSSFGPVTRTLTNGSYSAVIMFNGGSAPSIICTGYAAVSYNLPSVKRVIQVDTTNYSPYMAAMTARYGVTFSGSGMATDSYDSADPAHSTNGMYNAATRLATGDVASMYGPVAIQNATIRGKLKLGPTAAWDIGNGYVGDLAWSTVGQVQPGYFANDLNATFKDVDVPFSGGAPVVAVNIGTNTYWLGSGDYSVNGDLVLQNNETMFINGNVRLYVTGNFTMKSQNGTFLKIVPGGSLKVYIGTPGGAAVAGAFTQVNNTGFAGSFQVFGLKSLTSLTWNGNTAFVGTIYAPYADYSMGGGGSTDFDFQGACTVRSVNLNGHFNFHYDQNLARNQKEAGFAVISWREL
jgi:hypothetical protein